MLGQIESSTHMFDMPALHDQILDNNVCNVCGSTKENMIDSFLNLMLVEIPYWFFFNINDS